MKNSCETARAMNNKMKLLATFVAFLIPAIFLEVNADARTKKEVKDPLFPFRQYCQKHFGSPELLQITGKKENLWCTTLNNLCVKYKNEKNKEKIGREALSLVNEITLPENSYLLSIVLNDLRAVFPEGDQSTAPPRKKRRKKTVQFSNHESEADTVSEPEADSKPEFLAPPPTPHTETDTETETETDSSYSDFETTKDKAIDITHVLARTELEVMCLSCAINDVIEGKRLTQQFLLIFQTPEFEELRADPEFRSYFKAFIRSKACKTGPPEKQHLARVEMMQYIRAEKSNMPDPLKTLVKNLNEDQYVAIEDDYLDQIDKLSEEGVIRIFYSYLIRESGKRQVARIRDARS